MEDRPAASIRVDGWEKASGTALFVGDLHVADPWFGATVRSPVARGTLRRLEFLSPPAFDRAGVLFLTARDLPGPNAVAMIREDHPILAADRVQFAGEPLALLAAPDRDLLRRAVDACQVEITEEPPVLSIEDSLDRRAVIWGPDNIVSEYHIRQGDPEAAFSRADLICEGTYRTGHQEHLYLEPNGVIASPLAGGGVRITGSIQCPFYIHRALCRGLDLPPEKVVVQQAVTGGAFGGKEDYPSVLSLHAALLALRCGHPVRMILERSEDIRATTKRHPSRVDHRTGVLRDGTIVAAEIDVVFDAGAYTTLSPVVLSRGILHAAGAYRIENIAIRGRAVATNTPPNGAFRGFGAPQTIFAMERQIDRIAATLGLDPLQVRRKNLLRRGDRLPFGQILTEEPGASLVLERAVEVSGYEAKRRRPETIRGGTSGGRSRDQQSLRGIGLSLYLHGSGFTGSGEERIQGRVGVRCTREPAEGSASIEVLVSSVEMGQGASTVLCAIAAEELHLPIDRVRHAVPDTSQVPDSGPTVASRTTMIVGSILRDACRNLAGRLADALRERGIASAGSFLQDAERHLDRIGPLEAEAAYRPDPDSGWDEESHRGDAYKAYSWGADVVEVEVDPDTWEVHPVTATVAVEIGEAVDPVLACGQVEGGTLQALGFAYLEEMKSRDGRFLNDRAATYIIPTARDAPEIRVEIVRRTSEEAPRYRHKGLGELPADGGAPALAAAVSHATGLFACELPMTPERLLELSQGSAGAEGTGDGGNTQGARERGVPPPDLPEDAGATASLVPISFTVNGRSCSLRVDPLRPLLTILREDLGLTGTKEGCGEGECGACAVLLDGSLVHSCLVPALQLDGADVVTIEGLGGRVALQRAFLQEGAVQCGFCTPGMILAAGALLASRPQPEDDETRDALSGNLCRCTGYERIVRAVRRAADSGEFHPAAPGTGAAGRHFAAADVLRPVTLKEALAAMATGRPIRIVAGATDLLAGASADPPPTGGLCLDITRIPELAAIGGDGGTIEIGSCVTLAALAADPRIARELPLLSRAARLFGSPGIRNRATLGGNLITASPAADLSPALLALDAVVLLRGPEGRERRVPSAAFFTAYREVARRPDELLVGVRIPVPPEQARQAFYKVGTRQAQAISKVSLACRATPTPGGVLRDVRIAAGSVASTTVLLEEVRRHLEERVLRAEAVREAEEIAEREIRPIDDLRSTAAYRRHVTGRLVRRFLEDLPGAS